MTCCCHHSFSLSWLSSFRVNCIIFAKPQLCMLFLDPFCALSKCTKLLTAALLVFCSWISLELPEFGISNLFFFLMGKKRNSSSKAEQVGKILNWGLQKLMDRCNSIMKLPLQIYAGSVIFCISLCWNCFQMTSWDLFGDVLLRHLRVLPAWCSPIPQFLPVIQSQTQPSHIDSAAYLFLSYFHSIKSFV